jgi:hypothetical protein
MRKEARVFPQPRLHRVCSIAHFLAAHCFNIDDVYDPWVSDRHVKATERAVQKYYVRRPCHFRKVRFGRNDDVARQGSDRTQCHHPAEKEHDRGPSACGGIQAASGWSWGIYPDLRDRLPAWGGETRTRKCRFELGI